MIRDFAKLIPKSLSNRCGRVFYSGRSAFDSPSQLYILRINPGGDPRNHKAETVSSHTEWIRCTAPENWSAYRDESWEGCRPGRAKVQLRVLHLIQELGLDPRKVPASNVVFQRSKSKPRPKEKFELLASECWPFHEAVIRDLEVRVIVCFRGADNFVRHKVDARMKVDKNDKSADKMERSYSYVNSEGLTVVVVPHPSHNDWENPEGDPSELIKRALKRI